MNEHESTVVSEHSPNDITLRKYVIGFVGSVVLTLAAYALASHHSVSRGTIIALLVLLALAQFAVQLIYFLHLDSETKPRWKLAVLGFMIGIVLIIVFGSIWIMNNLNYRMTPQQQEQYMKSQVGL